MARENIISKHYKGLCLSSYCKLEEHVTSADLPCSCPNHQLIFKTLKQQVECRYFQKQIWEASIEDSILKFWVNMKGKLWEEEMRILKLNRNSSKWTRKEMKKPPRKENWLWPCFLPLEASTGSYSHTLIFYIPLYKWSSKKELLPEAGGNPPCASISPDSCVLVWSVQLCSKMDKWTTAVVGIIFCQG
jgi:hypothetical protein